MCRLPRSTQTLAASVLFLTAGSLSPCWAQSSASASLSLRAVLMQSLTVSATPAPDQDWRFAANPHGRNLPVIVTSNWVQGPAQVNVVAFSSPAFFFSSPGAAPGQMPEALSLSSQSALSEIPGGVLQGFLARSDPSAASPQSRINTDGLAIPAEHRGGILIIRAQAL